MGAELEFTGFVALVRKRWRLFLLVAAASAAVGAVISMPAIMRPRYKSTAVVFPVNLGSYSEESRTDQLLQLLESNSIRDSLIRRFDLGRVYEVDTAEKGGRFALYNEFKERVEVEKTKYESVRIDVLDEEPVRARDLVVGMLDQVNLLARRLQREKSAEVLAIAEREMAEARHRLDSVGARLDTLRRRTGLLSYEAQTNEVTRGYMRILSSGGSAAARDEARSLLRSLGERGGEFRSLSDLAGAYLAQFIDRQVQYERARTDMNKELTYTNVVVYPEVSDKKVWPVRWLVVLISVASASLLCFVLLLWRERNA
jgi:capsule polysaccharide export protein KpsE/RkpR